MKKVIKMSISLLLAALLCFSIASCGKKEETKKYDTTENNAPLTTGTIDNSKGGILGSITDDFTQTTNLMTEKLNETFENTGDEYEKYIANKDLIDKWYDFVLTESDNLFQRTIAQSKSYFESVVETIDTKDSKALDRAVEDYYDAIYDDAFDDYYDAIYEDAFEDMYDKYYDGIVSDAYDTQDDDKWFDISSECYDKWAEAHGDVYDKWADAHDDVYDIWTDVSDAFYEENYDISSVLDKKKTVITQKSSKKAVQTTTKAKSASKVSWKEFIDEYEDWVDSYVELAKKYKDNPSDLSILSDYTDAATEIVDWSEKAQDVQDELSGEDLTEYINALARISKKISEMQ